MTKLFLPFLLTFVIPLTLATGGCGGGSAPTAVPAEISESQTGGETMTFKLTSSAFAPGESIPSQYTCDGQDISPALQWADPPAGTLSFALIADDPDAPIGTWVHWVLFNLPPETRDLPEQTGPVGHSQDGNNSWKRTGYGGPCPPGGTHRYFFKLYALDTMLDLAAGADKKQLLQAMEGRILAQAEVMGVYSRQ